MTAIAPDNLDHERAAAKRGPRGEAYGLSPEAPRRRATSSVEDVGLGVAPELARLQAMVAVPPAISLDRLPGGQQDRQPDQKASSGSAIKESAPASSVRRCELLSGNMRSA